MVRIAPSILSADFSRLESDVSLTEKAGAHLIHVDVMDGHFVPNISYGATVMKSLLGKTRMPFDVHLMIENPDKYLEDFMTENTEYITVHQEACVHLDRTLSHIRALGAKAGVSVNPATPITVLREVLAKVDLVLIMTVNPGFGGQTFISECLDKVRELKALRDDKGYNFEIEIDGGVGLDNLEVVLDAGCDIIVAGSSVFKTKDIEATTREFVRMAKEHE